MIVPMKKISLIVLKNERKAALEVLRKSGVMHIERLQGTGADYAALKNNCAAFSSAVMSLSEYKEKIKKSDFKTLSKDEALAKALEINDLAASKKTLEERILKNTRELERFEKWGDVDPADFEELAEKGVYLSLYEITPAQYYELDESIKTILVNEDKNKRRFIALNSSKDTLVKMPQEASLVSMPDKSTKEIALEISGLKKELEAVEEKIKSYICFSAALKKNSLLFEKDLEFENIYSGMAQEAEDGAASLAWLTGFVPETEAAALKKVAAENNWGFASEDPSEEDEVPTQLKNNKLVSLIYPLTDFLGTVPGYNEFDISGWFLLFFTIFFGMIFGDGGYGLLVVLFALAMIVKSAIAKKEAAPIIKLALLLGISTVIWGTVTCTWFGVSADVLRNIGLGFLPKLSIPVLSSAYAEIEPGVPALFRLPWSAPDGGLTNTQCLQIFCFVLALLQLCVAHIKCIIRHKNSLKVLGEIGSLLQVVGMFWVVLMVVISFTEFPLDAVMIFGVIPIGVVFIVMIAVGFILSFIFSNYEGSVKDSVLASCKNIISVLLGIVNVFSDILSYVRLWAVGLAGSAISSTVNGMAVQIAGTAGPVIVHAIVFILAIVLIVFGHGLNMVLNLLSVIVHGVRLNTLEFSNHLTMEWSGTKYEPFSE